MCVVVCVFVCLCVCLSVCLSVCVCSCGRFSGRVLKLCWFSGVLLGACFRLSVGAGFTGGCVRGCCGCGLWWPVGTPSAGPPPPDPLCWTPPFARPPPLRRTHQHFALFSPLPPPLSLFVFFFSLSLSLSLSRGFLGGSCRGILVVFLKVGTLRCTRLGYRAVVRNPRERERERKKNTREDPEREATSENGGGRGETKARNFRFPTLRGPTIRDATLRGPPFGSPTLRGSTLQGPTIRGPHFFLCSGLHSVKSDSKKTGIFSA